LSGDIKTNPGPLDTYIAIFLGHFCPRGKGAWCYPYVKHQQQIGAIIQNNLYILFFWLEPRLAQLGRIPLDVWWGGECFFLRSLTSSVWHSKQSISYAYIDWLFTIFLLHKGIQFKGKKYWALLARIFKQCVIWGNIICWMSFFS